MAVPSLILKVYSPGTLRQGMFVRKKNFTRQYNQVKQEIGISQAYFLFREKESKQRKSSMKAQRDGAMK
jgi:hypothetical protein